FDGNQTRIAEGRRGKLQIETSAKYAALRLFAGGSVERDAPRTLLSAGSTACNVQRNAHGATRSTLRGKLRVEPARGVQQSAAHENMGFPPRNRRRSARHAVARRDREGSRGRGAQGPQRARIRRTLDLQRLPRRLCEGETDGQAAARGAAVRAVPFVRGH